jgi:flagellar assembly protein FliH
MSDNAAPRPFTFDRSFDLAAMKAAEAKTVAPTFSEQELALAREQAYGHGYVAGKEAALAEMQQQHNALLARLNRLFEHVAQDVWKVYAQQRQAATDIAVAIARKIVPDYVKRNGLKEIMAAVETSVTEMINEPRLVLRIHERHFDYISQEVNNLSQRLGYAGKIIVLTDNAIGEHDCRLEWADGGMERNLNLTWSEVDRQIARHHGSIGLTNVPPPPPPDSNPPTPPSTDIAV